MYRLLLHPNIEKQLAKIPIPSAHKIADAIRALCDDPRPAQSKPLSEQLYRVREGEYHIIYAVFDHEQIVFIRKVARRSEKVYRDLNTLLAAAKKAVQE